MRMRRSYRRLSLVLISTTAALVYIFTGHGFHLPRNTYAEREGDSGMKKIDINKNDVIVLLHIPRTGMTSLSNHLIKDAEIDTPCTCQPQMTKCKCLNKNGQHWLFNSYNTTGYVCGKQADFTTLINCPIDNWFRTSGKDTRSMRRYFIITMLREPISRYISEYLFAKNEDTYFKNEPRLFRYDSLELQKKELPCFVGKKLSTLTLEDFVNCKENPARNRQTRMLANLKEVNSLGLHGDQYDEALLASAKTTLETLPFFGLLHRPKDMQLLLEAEFGFRFKETFKNKTTASQALFPLPGQLRHRLLQEVDLDIRLMTFANELFQERLRVYKDSFRSQSNEVTDSFKIVYRPDLRESEGETEDEGEEKGVDIVDVEDGNEKDDEDAADDDLDNGDEDNNATAENKDFDDSDEDDEADYLGQYNVDDDVVKPRQKTEKPAMDQNTGHLQSVQQNDSGGALQTPQQNDIQNLGDDFGDTAFGDGNNVAGENTVGDNNEIEESTLSDNNEIANDDNADLQDDGHTNVNGHVSKSRAYPDDTEDVSTFLKRLESVKQERGSNAVISSLSPSSAPAQSPSLVPAQSQQQQHQLPQNQNMRFQHLPPRPTPQQQQAFEQAVLQQQRIKQAALRRPPLEQQKLVVPPKQQQMSQERQQQLLQNNLNQSPSTFASTQNELNQHLQQSVLPQRNKYTDDVGTARHDSPRMKPGRTEEEKMIHRMYL